MKTIEVVLRWYVGLIFMI